MIVSRPDLDRLVSANAVSRRDGESVTVDLVSICLHLDCELVYYTPSKRKFVPPADVPTRSVMLQEGAPVDFSPGTNLLACSLEYIQMPLDHMGFIQTKGSLARGFVLAHMCDGQIDPGFAGKVTFELVNLSDFTYQLVAGMPIAQLFLLKLSSPLGEGYNGRYQGADRPTAMKSLRQRKS